MGFTDRDESFLNARGISMSWAREQAEMLRNREPDIVPLRPATIGDGIIELDDKGKSSCAEYFRARRTAFKISKFVPASGAATRMFSILHPEAPGHPDQQLILDQWNKLPFASLIPQDITRQELPAFILGDSGLGYGNLPKGLLPFFCGPEGMLTPLDIHLREAGRYGGSAIHLTVAEKWFDKFAHHAKQYPEIATTLSVQQGMTDLLAMDHDGKLLRNKDGTLFLRPGGHGALLDNLMKVDASIVFIKNIDNVLTGSVEEETAKWREAMAGLLMKWVDEHGCERPVRVCAMVPNHGEPGGGPFWVLSGGEERLQIVERSECRGTNAAKRGTHFNPVDMVCLIRKEDNRTFDLLKYRDMKRFMMGYKTIKGRRVKILEWPGLWNGGMADWQTIFVAVPPYCFKPVKTIMDLLRH